MLRSVLSLSAAALALTLSACGGETATDVAADASAGTSAAATTGASVEDFCSVLTTAKVNTGKQVAALALSLSETGSPSDMTTKQRNGFEQYVALLESIDPTLTKKQLQALTDFDLTTKQQNQITAFFTYASTTCTTS